MKFAVTDAGDKDPIYATDCVVSAVLAEINSCCG